MSNRSERNRLKRKARIQKLLGDQYEVDSYYGHFRAYNRKAFMEQRRTIQIDFKAIGLNWHITCPELGLDWTGSPLRHGVKVIHATMLLVS